MGGLLVRLLRWSAPATATLPGTYTPNRGVAGCVSSPAPPHHHHGAKSIFGIGLAQIQGFGVVLG